MSIKLGLALCATITTFAFIDSEVLMVVAAMVVIARMWSSAFGTLEKVSRYAYEHIINRTGSSS